MKPRLTLSTPRGRLVLFLWVSLACSLMFVVLDAVGWARGRASIYRGWTLVQLAVSALIASSLWWTRLMGERAATLAISLVVLMTGVFFSAVAPGDMSTHALFPALAVALSLPMLGRKGRFLFVGAAILSMVAVGMLETAERALTRPRGEFDVWVSWAGVLTGTALVTALFWGYVEELRGHLSSLERTKADLKTAVRARDDFLSIASHELKTPLTPLNLEVHTLRRRAQLLENPERPWWEEKLNRLDRQLRRLSKLVDQLLDLSRISAGKLSLTIEPVDLAAVAQEVIRRFTDSAEAAPSVSGLSLSTSGQTVGMWDRLRVDQLVTNLVGNALKYGEGKPVKVSVRREGQQAALEVEDQGIGIAPADQQRIFGRFERAVSGRHFGGMGVGLYIVRQVVEALGGELQVKSALGEGTRFTVLLPLERSAPPAGPQ